MNTAKYKISFEAASERLNYDPETGRFTWRSRAEKTPIDAKWNVQRAGKEAGFLTFHGYRLIRIDGVLYRAHLLAWLLVHERWPEEEIDHRDRNRDNNAIDNLREATRVQNCGNRSLAKNNKSGRKGVSWHSREQRWRARIGVNGKQRHLGSFKDLDKAAEAYQRAAREVYGDFATDGVAT